LNRYFGGFIEPIHHALADITGLNRGQVLDALLLEELPGRDKATPLCQKFQWGNAPDRVLLVGLGGDEEKQHLQGFTSPLV
jgi:hypothetical protein